MDVRVGRWRKLSAKELMLLNCGVGEDSWESLGLQRNPTSPFHSKGDQSWVFFGRSDAKAETLVLWPPHANSWLLGKDSDAGWHWGQKEKGTTEDEMAGWHHRLNGHESEWTPGVGDGQRGLECCNSWGHRVGHDWATELNWTLPSVHFTIIDDWLMLLFLEPLDFTQHKKCLIYQGTTYILGKLKRKNSLKQFQLKWSRSVVSNSLWPHGL